MSPGALELLLSGALLLSGLPGEPPDDRISFSIPLPEEQGGGEAHGVADDLEYQEGAYARASGRVEVRYQDMTFRADQVSLDLPTQELVAEGNVVVDQGPNRMTGSYARFDLDTKLGYLDNARGALDQDVFVDGRRITRVALDRFLIEDGTFTSCEGPVPPWSFSVSRADVTLEDYARIRNASMRVKTLPVLYLPWVVWPTKTERSSGLLVPKIGNSNDRGSYLGLAYYQVLGRSWDTTFYTDLYTESYFAVGNELRYHPTDGTYGSFQGYAIDDPTSGDWRWKVNWDHVSDDLPGGWRGVLRLEDYSDFRFFRDFERQLDAKAKDSIYSRAFASRSWGNQSVNVTVDHRQRFFDLANILDLRRLPEASYDLRPTQLFGSSVYLSMDGRAGFLSQDRPGLYAGEYGRVDLAPNLKYTPFSLPWLSLTLQGGGRYTWYGDSVGTTPEEPGFTGQALSRLVPTAGAEVVGPSFSRLFTMESGPFARLLHVVEPRFVYGFADDFEEQNAVPFFDEFDSVGRFNEGTVSITNRLLAKRRPDEKGEEQSAREILSIELARSFAFDDDVFLEQGAGLESRSGPFTATVRSYPTDVFGLSLRTRYSALFSRLTSVRLASELRLPGGNRFDVAWSPGWDPASGETAGNQISVGGLWNALPGRLTLATGINYDIERELLRDQRHFVTWQGSCYTLRFELHESRTVTQRRRDYLFSVDLKNVGTFLDLTGGQSEGF